MCTVLRNERCLVYSAISRATYLAQYAICSANCTLSGVTYTVLHSARCLVCLLCNVPCSAYPIVPNVQPCSCPSGLTDSHARVFGSVPSQRGHQSQQVAADADERMEFAQQSALQSLRAGQKSVPSFWSVFPSISDSS